LLATPLLTTTERAAKISPIRIPPMGQKANSAVAAVGRTDCRTERIAQDGIQSDLILTNKRKNALVLMPLSAKRKEFPDGYDKNARFSVRILKLFSMSSSYSLDAEASRGRPGIFCGFAQHSDDLAEQRIHPPIAAFLHSLAQPISSHHPPQTRYLERRTRS
jgi:hypothetical protein